MLGRSFGFQNGDFILTSLLHRRRLAVAAADTRREMNTRPPPCPKTARQQLARFPDTQCFLNNQGDNVWVTVDFARNSTLLEIVCSDAFYIPTLCQILISIMTTDSPLVVLHLHGLVRRVILPVLAKSETFSVLESCFRLLSMSVVRDCCAFVPSATWGRCIRFESGRHVQFLCLRLMARCIHENKLFGSPQHCAVRENHDVLVDCCITGPLQNRISALKLVKASKILSESGMRRLEEARLNMPSGFDRNFKWQLLAVANAEAMVLCKSPLSLQSVQCILSGYESPTDRGEIYKWGCIAKEAIMSLAGSDVHLDPGATPAARLAWSQILLKAQTQFYIPQRIWEAGLRLVPFMVCDFIRDVAATGSVCYAADTTGDMKIYGGSVAAEFLRHGNCEDARASADMLLSAHADAIMQLSVLSNDMLDLDLSRPDAFCRDVEVKNNLFRDLVAGCTQLMRMEGLHGTISQESSSSPLLQRTAKLLVQGVIQFLHFQISIACNDPFCKCWDTDIVRIGTDLMNELYSTDIITLDTEVLRSMKSYVSSVSTSSSTTYSRMHREGSSSLVGVSRVYASLSSQIWPLGPEACLLGIEGCLGLLELAEEVDHYGMSCLRTVERDVRTCFFKLSPTQLCSVPDICTLLAAAARRQSSSRAESSWLTSVLVQCQEGERLVAHSDCLMHDLSQPFPTLYSGKILPFENKSIEREERIFERLYRPGGEGRKLDAEIAQVEMSLVPYDESSARGRKRPL